MTIAGRTRVEEQFYLVLPAALALLAVTPSPARIVSAIVGVLLLGIALRGHAWLHELSSRRIDGAAGPDFGPAYLRSLYYPTWTRLDGLLAGIVAALVRTFRPRLWHAVIDKGGVCLIAGLLGLAVSMRVFSQLAAGPLPSLFGFPLLSVSLAAIVVAGCSRHAIDQHDPRGPSGPGPGDSAGRQSRRRLAAVSAGGATVPDTWRPA